MKSNRFIISLLAIAACVSIALGQTAWSADPNLQTLRAFPGAEGFGANVTGGRGGKVLYVTNLNNSGEGSLRWAIEQTGARIIMFKVAGEIKLTSAINIRNGDLTIAGHSAPGDGICISGNTVQISASNIIIRHMRFRMGDLNAVEGDALWGRNQSNIIIDHCSMSWATDEVASFYDNENFTLQWSMLYESLRVSVHDKGSHGYLGIWGGRKASFHHNLIAHHDSRNPRFNGARYSNRASEELVDFRNNVIYNWGSNSGYAGEGGSYNMVNNYYQPGPESGNAARIFQPNADNGSNSQAAGVWGKFYISGNVMMNANGTTNTSVTNDNWAGVHPNPSSQSKSDLRSNTEFEKGTITTHTAQQAYDLVLAGAGASFKRDSTDARVVNEVRNRTAPKRASGGGGTKAGLIDTQKDVGGWAAYTFKSTDIPVDTDGDGMPDAWESAYGLNPNSAADGSSTSLMGGGSGKYTNLEVYLYSILAGTQPPPPPAWTLVGSGAEFIDSLRITDAENAADWSVQNNFVTSVNAYGDREHKITSVPAAMQGAEWIKAAMDSRVKTSPDTLASFTMKKAGTVYIAHENRVSPKPSWLAERGFTATGQTLTVTESSDPVRTFSIYSKQFNASETVALGNNSNNGTTSSLMYIVAAGAGTTSVMTGKAAQQANYAMNVVRAPNGNALRVNYSVKDRGTVRIYLFNIKGNRVRTLVNSSKDAGVYQEHLNTEGLAAGMYIAKLKAGTHVLQQRIMVSR
ncbi:MAG: T9SS type A sorting domain-containing protein [Chitinispirillales bacterium]|jgi:hypothetical protein|nr:T9SS type A sorting domain-containing protein [Chitinispirillales bacterium]